MDINQFTLNAQKAVQAAQSLASEHGHQQVDNEHLFLALLRQEESVVDPILKKIGVEPSAVEKSLEHDVKGLPKVEGDNSFIFPHAWKSAGSRSKRSGQDER